MNTFAYPDPYKFDARNGKIPSYRAPWYRNIGIRSRSGLLRYSPTTTTLADSINQVETGLLSEATLETAWKKTRSNTIAI